MITRSETDWNKDSDKYLGKLRANFVGTEFQVNEPSYFQKKRARVAVCQLVGLG